MARAPKREPGLNGEPSSVGAPSTAMSASSESRSVWMGARRKDGMPTNGMSSLPDSVDAPAGSLSLSAAILGAPPRGWTGLEKIDGLFLPGPDYRGLARLRACDHPTAAEDEPSRCD